MDKPEKVLDSLLVLSYQAGDKKALELLVKRWHKKLCIQAFRYTKDWAKAQDIAQDTWKTAIAKLGTLKNPNSFGSWAMTIANRKALDKVKKDAINLQNLKQHFKEKENEAQEFEFNKEQDIAKVIKALAELPIHQKMVLTLFYLEEYNLKEISTITNVTVNTVKTRLFRAREKMKAIIKNQ